MSLHGRAYVEMVGSMAITITICLLVGQVVLKAQLQQTPPEANLGAPIFSVMQMVLLALVGVLAWVSIVLGQSVLGSAGGSR